MKVITIPTLDKYQHYKDRPTNPWIKWHKACLRDHKFCQLTNGERWIFIGLVILATENNNEIPADFYYISRKISFSSRGLSKTMLKLTDLKLIAIKRVARRYQDADLDKIREDKNKIREDNSLNKLYKDAKEVIKEKTKFPK